MKRIVTLLLLCLFAAFALADTPHASLQPVRTNHHRVQRHRAHKAAKHHAVRHHHHRRTA